MKTKQIVAIVVVFAIILLAAFVGFGNVSSQGTSKTSLRPYVSVIEIYGSIGEVGYDLFGNEVTLSPQAIVNYIDEIKEDEMNAGIFLAIDSPGGTVYDSDRIYRALMEYKEETGRPIQAGTFSMICSGAYYIGAAADKICAERTAVIGSIGVYMEHQDFSELLDKVGISIDYIRSGENKAMGNPYNAMTDEQRKIFQESVDEDYERFLDIVKESRGYTDSRARLICDGRTYTATQSINNGLIDEICDVDDALYAFQEELDVYDVDYPYVASEDWLSRLVGGVIKAFPKSDLQVLQEMMANRKDEVYAYAG